MDHDLVIRGGTVVNRTGGAARTADVAVAGDRIVEVGRLATEGIRAGAVGFTTSRTLNQRTRRAHPTPTLTAAREELVGIARAAAELLGHAHTVPGLSDGGAHVGTICDASFPTTLLAHWARDRARGTTFELPFLIQRQCRGTAEAVGLLDRGLLAPDYKADVNVIDFDHLALEAPTVVHDLPARGKRLMQRARGYLHTFVSGVETQAEGEPTGELPERLVRGARPDAAAGVAS